MGLNWLRKRDSSSEALEAQFAAAQSAHSTALAAVDAAQASFDEDGSETAVRSLLKSREAVQLAGEHLARATRLLDAGRARDAEARREALRVELAELRVTLRHEGMTAALAPLETEEARLLEQVADVRYRRLQLQDARTPLLGRYHGICVELGVDTTIDDRVSLCTSHVAVERLLQARMAEFPDGDCRRALLRELLPDARSYRRQ